MNNACHACGRTLATDHESCLYCGAKAPLPEVFADHTARCPRCRDQMRSVDVAGVVVDVCAGCGGSWYDKGEFEVHLDNVRQRVTPGTTTGPAQLTNPKLELLPCARCGQNMLRKNFDGASGVIVDVCGDHGVFLDQGELAAIARYVGSARQRAVQASRQASEAAKVSRATRSLARRAAAAARDDQELRHRTRHWGWPFWW